jgi:hypothetical protein
LGGASPESISPAVVVDSGPGACAPSRNDDPLDMSGFMESMV